MATWKTSDGVVIEPGLRVFTNDWCWGTVEKDQFNRPGPCNPGGEYFTGWFRVELDDKSMGVKLYNGERMTTTRPPALANL